MIIEKRLGGRWRAINQRGISQSIIRFLADRTGERVDEIEDGYEYPNTRPLITVEQMQNNYEYNVKNREAVEATYRFQIGLHTEYLFERKDLQEVVADLFIFEDIPHYRADEVVGFFSVEVTSIMPMPADEISRHSKRHTVYLDVEIQSIKRRR